MTGKQGRSGGTRTGAGRPPADPVLRALWQATGLRGPALREAAAKFAAENMERFAQWCAAKESNGR
jgi:hypothetical protein